jgi:hypothetical protein
LSLQDVFLLVPTVPGGNLSSGAPAPHICPTEQMFRRGSVRKAVPTGDGGNEGENSWFPLTFPPIPIIINLMNAGFIRLMLMPGAAMGVAAFWR